MKEVVICIPVYKSIPNLNELRSFNQCLKVLGVHKICVVTFKSLNIEFYTKIFEQNNISFDVQFFQKYFFQSIHGYNKLLVSRKFYKKFEDYRYLLIYQLDAYVFRDELLAWCSQGFSFIGAPWVDVNVGINQWQVGNGGLSLRNVKDHLRVLHTFSFINGFLPMVKKAFRNESMLLKKIFALLLVPMKFILDNNTFFLLNHFNNNEDYFWSVICSRNFNWYVIPDAKIAMRFSFETQPTLLYEIYGNLPFGCHAWEKRDPLFWSEKFETCG